MGQPNLLTEIDGGRGCFLARMGFKRMEASCPIDRFQ